MKIADDLPLELLAPLGCGIQTGVGGVTRSLNATAGSSILITGGGSVGLSAVLQACATIILVEPVATRRDLALELGATHVIDPVGTRDLAQKVRKIASLGVGFAFDTTGVPSIHQSVIASLGSKGVFGFVGVSPPGTSLPGDANSVMTFGQTIKGIVEGDSDPDEFIPELIDHFQVESLPLNKMIKTYPFDQINEAIAEQHQGLCVKPVLLKNHED